MTNIWIFGNETCSQMEHLKRADKGNNQISHKHRVTNEHVSIKQTKKMETWTLFQPDIYWDVMFIPIFFALL